MVDWLAGKRIKGTSSERTSLSTTTLGATNVGGWVEVGRTSGSGSSITVSNLPNKRYYMILCDLIPTGGQITSKVTFNGDGGTKYAWRNSLNGSNTDSTLTSTTNIADGFGGDNVHRFHIGYLANYSTKEKLYIEHMQNQGVAGATNMGERQERVGKWANTTDPINSITFTEDGSGSYGSGSQLVVLGYDPADSHTNNFWTELADASWSSGGSISSGTFTAKKYLWIQGWHKNDSNATGYATLRVGNTTVDATAKYSNRYNQNASGEFTETENNFAYIYGSNNNASSMTGFFNIFIINNASLEKLMINHYVASGVSGANYAPDRWESVHKWVNTSNQINIVELLRSSNNFTAGQIKVWGAD